MTALEVSSVLGIDFGRECLRVALSGDPNCFIAYGRELFDILAVVALAAITHYHGRKTLAVSASQCTAVNGGMIDSTNRFLNQSRQIRHPQRIYVLTI